MATTLGEGSEPWIAKARRIGSTWPGTNEIVSYFRENSVDDLGVGLLR
jgi:hypothetical protein